jgi:hypothetical protein
MSTGAGTISHRWGVLLVGGACVAGPCHGTDGDPAGPCPAHNLRPVLCPAVDLSVRP